MANGYEDGAFKPSNYVTRAIFSIFLAQALNDD
ncbi:S-layer homology domain-containing protein [Cytobacillus massiliigabonensis]